MSLPSKSAAIDGSSSLLAAWIVLGNRHKSVPPRKWSDAGGKLDPAARLAKAIRNCVGRIKPGFVMLITTAAVATQVIVVVFPGLVLHRALAMWVLALDKPANPDGEIREADLVVYGLLPGLAIVNEIDTILALLKLFRLEVYLAVVAAAVIWRRQDTAATLRGVRDLGVAIWQSLVRGELMTVVVIAIFLQTAFALLIVAQLPSLNVDVWNHNLPLAQSIVAHRGYVLPQIPNMFYGTYPIFFHMFFAQALLFVDHVVAAKVINSIIYLGFLLSLLCTSTFGRALSGIVLFFLIIGNPLFTNGAPDVMTDVPRVCFSVLAFVFAYRYLRTGRTYFLFAAGLLAGGAVAGKYTELLTPVLIGLSLLPVLAQRTREGLIAIGVFSASCLAIACYPYLRNWILLDNPIYPFMFAHPGLSDQYMAELTAEVFHSLDPAYRSFEQNLLTMQGWHDFFRAARDVFLGQSILSYAALALIGIGAVIPRSRLIWPTLWTAALAIFWYTIGYMNARWGFTAYMSMLATAFLSSVLLIDRVVCTVDSVSSRWPRMFPIGAKASAARRSVAWLSPKKAALVTIGALALLVSLRAIISVSKEGIAGLLPGWSRQAGKAMFSGELDTYLSRHVPGYQVYRFIAAHDLRTVLIPLDNAASFSQSACNGGRNGNWVFPWNRLPAAPTEYNSFLRDNSIRYFVFRSSLAPIEADRLDRITGHNHVEQAVALMRYMIPRSRLILVDPFGWELYAFDGALVPEPR
jgi:hypothetical protein